MISQTGKQRITMYKLPNIYRRKSNQIMKFSLSKLFFSKIHAKNMVEKPVPGPFLKNQNWVYLRINSLKFSTVCFYCLSKSRTTRKILKLPRWSFVFKGALSGLRRFLATESSSKMMKNAFYFTSKALFALKIFKFLSWHFGNVAKQLEKKDKVNFKSYDVTAWLTNNCNTDFVQYVEK